MVSNKTGGLLGYVLLLSLAAAFFLSFSTHFLGLRSGNGEFSGGMALLHGDLPYRDYFTAGPPLNTLKSAALLTLFGRALLVSRLAGIAVRLVLVVLLYRWLRRIAGPADALIAALLTIVLSAGDQTDPIASYNHDAILWAVVAGLLSASALCRSGRPLRWLAFGAGFSAGLSLLTKQTVGGGALLVTLLVPSVLLARRSSHLRNPGRWASATLVGAALPIVAVLAVLQHLGVLRAALAMLFVRGPAAKAGHPGDFLIRVGLVAADNLGWLVLGLFWLALLWRPLRRGVAAASSSPRPSSSVAPLSRRALVLTALAGTSLLADSWLLRSFPALHDFSKSVVYTLCFGLVLLAPWAIAPLLRRGRSASQPDQLCLFWCTSAAVAGTLALSWPAFEAMLVPGLGLLAALGLRGCTSRQRPVLLSVFALWAFMQMREKLDLPFSFDRQAEAPVREALASSAEPALHGLRLPQSTVSFVDQTTAIIRSATHPGDTIFTYPEMDLFYTVTGHLPPTLARSHNMDVVNDSLAREEADRLLHAAPVVLITYPETDADRTGAERLWRRGHPSGQRSIVAALAALEPMYQPVSRAVLRPGDPPITVWVRNDRLASLPPSIHPLPR